MPFSEKRAATPLHTSSPSASQRSTRISTICGKGTGCGKRESSFCVRHRCENITSIMLSTSRATALVDVDVPLSLPSCNHEARFSSHLRKPNINFHGNDNDQLET